MAEKETLVKCSVNNIWTSKGKLVKGGSVMLPSDEAKKLKAVMKKIKEGK